MNKQIKNLLVLGLAIFLAFAFRAFQKSDGDKTDTTKQEHNNQTLDTNSNLEKNELRPSSGPKTSIPIFRQSPDIKSQASVSGFDEIKNKRSSAPRENTTNEEDLPKPFQAELSDNPYQSLSDLIKKRDESRRQKAIERGEDPNVRTTNPYFEQVAKQQRQFLKTNDQINAPSPEHTPATPQSFEQENVDTNFVPESPNDFQNLNNGPENEISAPDEILTSEEENALIEDIVEEEQNDVDLDKLKELAEQLKQIDNN